MARVFHTRIVALILTDTSMYNEKEANVLLTGIPVTPSLEDYLIAEDTRHVTSESGDHIIME